MTCCLKQGRRFSYFNQAAMKVWWLDCDSSLVRLTSKGMYHTAVDVCSPARSHARPSLIVVNHSAQKKLQYTTILQQKKTIAKSDWWQTEHTIYYTRHCHSNYADWIYTPPHETWKARSNKINRIMRNVYMTFLIQHEQREANHEQSFVFQRIYSVLTGKVILTH